jgi:ABC-type transport system involved in cytochrome c biogenesis permease subunit
MNRRTLIPLGMCLLLVSICGCRGQQAQPEDRIFDDETVKFFSELDTHALRTLAAQYGGRKAGALDSAASDTIQQITGSETPDGIHATAAYLEFYFNAGKYLSKPIIFVRSNKIRRVVSDNLDGKNLEVFKRTSRIAPAAIMLGSGESLMAMVQQNPYVRQMVMAGRISIDDVRVTKPIGTLGDRWGRLLEQEAFRIPISRLSRRYDAFVSIELRLMPNLVPAAGDDPAAVEAWINTSDLLIAARGQAPSPEGKRIVNLREAWIQRDASKVNEIISEIAVAGAAADGYPSPERLTWELRYNDMDKGHPAFAGFVVAFVMFIIVIATGNRWLRAGAMAIMTVSTVFIGGAWVLRWIVGGEAWYLPPMMSQYGALVSSAVLAAVLAIIIELFKKYNYIALAACFYAAAVLVWVYFGNVLFPGKVDSSIGGVRGILKNSLMIVHVSVIVVGHALAGMTVVTSAAYVLIACFKGLDGKASSSPPGLFGPVGDSALASADRCNLILAQGACWTLIVGTLLGAWWADRAWSRWWGWDPKETWALITCLFFLAVLHVRLVTSSRHRGLLTAVACILGGIAMLFNWFAVNYLFSGLHSYG